MAEVPAQITTSQLQSKLQPILPYLLPIVAVMASVALFALYITPSISDNLAMKDEVDANAAKAARLDTKISILKSIDQAKLTADLAKTEPALPSEKDIAGFLALVNQLASNAGTSVDSAQLVPSVASATAEKNSIDFQVVLKGNFGNVKSFLTNLETSRRIMVVKVVNLNTSDTTVLSADLSIRTFYEPAPNVTPGNDTPLPVLSDAQQKLLTDLGNRTILLPPINQTTTGGRPDPFAGL